MAHIAVISDLGIIGSGYMNIAIPICDGLVELGHEIKAIGLTYKGEEHDHKFSILSANNIQECLATLQNVYNMWSFEYLIVALDIPVQEAFLKEIKKTGNVPFKYIGVFPIEADPLCMSWGMAIMQMDKAYIISKFGYEETQKIGITNAEYIEIGIDTDAWRQPTEEERAKLRTSLGFAEDEFVILTVADNQERKNLSRSMEIFTDFLHEAENVDIHKIKEENLVPKKKAKYVLVTRKHLAFGWRIDDLAQDLGILNHLFTFERGMGFKQLWSLYATADVFLLTSKAEGLGMPLLEAQAVGVPCIGTNCTAIAEVLGEGRGLLLEPDYSYRDPFGNGRRYFAGRKHGVELLEQVYKKRPNVEKALEYVKARDWKTAVNQINDYIKENENE